MRTHTHSQAGLLINAPKDSSEDDNQGGQSEGTQLEAPAGWGKATSTEQERPAEASPPVTLRRGDPATWTAAGTPRVRRTRKASAPISLEGGYLGGHIGSILT